MNFVRDLMPFSESKLRPNLKMAAQRIQLVNSKKENSIKHQKREIANLLMAGKEEKARIRAEHMIREDFTIEAYEIIALLCDLVHERMKHLLSQDECPPDLLDSVATLLYAAPRCDISELEVVEKQFVKRYGKKFSNEVTIPEKGYVNPRIVEKLAVKPPSADAVLQYLKRIADEFNVDWTPTEIGVPNKEDAIPTPMGYSVPMAPGSQYGEIYYSGNGEAQAQEPPPSFAMSMKDQSVGQMESPPEYSAGGVKIRNPKIDDTSNDVDGMTLPSPPAYIPPTDGTDLFPPGGRNDNGGGGEVVMPEIPVAQAVVHMPAAPGDNANVAPLETAPASSTTPDYDELAARFAALSK